MDWIAAQYAGTVGASASVCSWMILPDDLANIFTNPTLMVSRVVCAMRSISAHVNAQGGLACGLIEWSSVNNALPLICPSVFLDADYDWILRQVFESPTNTLGGTVFTLALDEQYMSKARRRLETGNSLLMVVSNDTNDAVTFSSDWRCLIKE
jgi:hypothetical protein